MTVFLDEEIEPFSVSIETAARLTGICRSRLYYLIAEGRLDARKYGKSTLIIADSLRKFLNNLPLAKIRRKDLPQSLL